MQNTSIFPGAVVKNRLDPVSNQQILKWRRLKYYIFASDLLAFALAFTIGGIVFQLTRTYSPKIVSWFWLNVSITGLALVRFAILGHYQRRKPFWDELREIYHVLLILFLVEGFFLFVIKAYFSRLLFLTTMCLPFILIPLFRFITKKVLIAVGKWQIPTAIIGTGPNALAAAAALNSESLMGYDLQFFLAPPGDIPKSGSIEFAGRHLPVRALGNDAIATIRKLGRPKLVMALEMGGITTHLDLIKSLNRTYHNLSIVPDFRGLPLLGMEVNHFFRHEVLMMRVQNNLARPMQQFGKRIFDIAASALLLLALSPLFAFFVWKIRQSGGSAFFGHTRIGQNGKPFQCFKFRSMVPNAQEVLQELLATDAKAREEWDRDFKLKNDPRITPIGAFLRRTSLDELPQLWNVLKGDMSLVGPRPIVEEELERYGDDVNYYLEAKPGMTGLWQISGRNDTDYANRVYLDVWYVKNWSLWYDIAILFKTTSVVLHKQGAY